MTPKGSFSRRFIQLLGSAVLFSGLTLYLLISPALSLFAWHEPDTTNKASHLQLGWLQAGQTHHWHFNSGQGQFSQQALPNTQIHRLLWLNTHVELGILRHHGDLAWLSSKLEQLRLHTLNKAEHKTGPLWFIHMDWQHELALICALITLYFWLRVFTIRPK